MPQGNGLGVLGIAGAVQRHLIGYRQVGIGVLQQHQTVIIRTAFCVNRFQPGEAGQSGYILLRQGGNDNFLRVVGQGAVLEGDVPENTAGRQLFGQRLITLNADVLIPQVKTLGIFGIQMQTNYVIIQDNPAGSRHNNQ